MKILFTLFILSLSAFAFGQNINITVDKTKSSCFDNRIYNKSTLTKSIDSAFIIMNAVFNSTEFKALLEKPSFPCNNRCCIGCEQNQSKINNKEILDSLFKELKVSMAIKLNKKCNAKLGSTNHKEYKTIACFENIRNDMPKLPLAYAIAVNLCHEYMHHIGFYHSIFCLSGIDNETPNLDGYNNDIAYRIGWDVYQLLGKWKERGVKIDGL